MYRSEVQKSINLAMITDKIAGIKLGKSGMASVIDKNGTIIINKDLKGQSLNSIVSEADYEKIINTDNDWLTYDVEGTKKLSYVKKYDFLKWTIVYDVEFNELFQDLNGLIFKLVIISYNNNCCYSIFILWTCNKHCKSNYKTK